MTQGEEVKSRVCALGLTASQVSLKQWKNSHLVIIRSKWYDIHKARQCGVSAECQDEQLLYMADLALSTHLEG